MVAFQLWEVKQVKHNTWKKNSAPILSKGRLYKLLYEHMLYGTHEKLVVYYLSPWIVQIHTNPTFNPQFAERRWLWRHPQKLHPWKLGLPLK